MWGEVGRCDADETCDGQEEIFVSAPSAVAVGDLEVEGARWKYLSRCIP